MSPELGPSPPTDGIGATLARAPKIGAKDRSRLVFWKARVEAGLSHEQAWLETLIHPQLGIRPHRGNPSASPAAVARTLANFLCRVSPFVSDDARWSSQMILSEAAPKAARRIVDLVDNVPDPKAAPMQLAASRCVLESVGVLSKGAGSTTINANGPTAIGLTFGEFLRRTPT